MATTSPARSRTIEWHDPKIMAEAAKSKSSGLDYLRKFLTRDLPPPPISNVLGMWMTEIEEGRAVFEMEVAEYHYNPIGMVHGGVEATLLDSAMGCAVHSTLVAGESYTTLEFKVNFTRALTSSVKRVRSEARVVHRGKTTAISEATVVDEAGRVYARATCTCLIFTAP